MELRCEGECRHGRSAREFSCEVNVWPAHRSVPHGSYTSGTETVEPKGVMSAIVKELSPVVLFALACEAPMSDCAVMIPVKGA